MGKVVMGTGTGNVGNKIYVARQNSTQGTMWGKRTVKEGVEGEGAGAGNKG